MSATIAQIGLRFLSTRPTPGHWPTSSPQQAARTPSPRADGRSATWLLYYWYGFVQAHAATTPGDRSKKQAQTP
jgi:hypothetical protein